MTDYENLISTALTFRHEGHRIVLVTLIGSDGSSPRPVGSQMIVSEDGRREGFLTGGCAENVIVDAGLSALAEGRSQYLRLGSGSPYIDVRLPCGAGIDLFIDVDVDDDVLNRLAAPIRARVPVALDTCMVKRANHQCFVGENTAPPPSGFRRWFYPRRRLLIFGKGPNVLALANLALASEYEVVVASPDSGILHSADASGAEVQALTTPDAFSLPPVDPWTAAVLMFHEHEWEPELLEALFETDCFYIGALGSHRTHQQRLDSLAERGRAMVDHRLHGPVGLSIGSATPTEIGISILAEITQVYRGTARPLLTANPINRLLDKAS